VLLIEFFKQRPTPLLRVGRSRQLDRIFRRIIVAGLVLLRIFVIGSVGFYFIGGEAAT